MDIAELIDKYGPELTKQLQIASSDLYDKILWYTRIDGIVNLIGYTVFVIIMVVLNLIAIKIAKNIWKKTDKYDKDILPYVMVFVMGNLLGGLITLGLLITFVNSIAKIISPEYWIIHQIIQRLGQV